MQTSQVLPLSRIAPQGRILLAEDETTSMAILSAYLRAAGYDVEQAEHGEAAWQMLERDRQFDLLVTDRSMPVMDGLELAQRVRNDQRLRHIPVIMQTSKDSQADILEGIRAGVYYYLVKPYEEATLVGIVRSALQNRRQQALFEQRIHQQQDALDTFVSGEFRLSTPEEAQNLALLLGTLFPRPELAVSGLYELLLNGVEHGNLGVGFDAKSRLLETGQWDAEIARRQALPENSGKKVTVRFRQEDGRVEATISDTGSGFDWRPFMEIEPSRATQGNGRGVAKAALLCFDRVEFQGNGNTVKVKSGADVK